MASAPVVFVFSPFRFEVTTGALRRGQRRSQLRPQVTARTLAEQVLRLAHPRGDSERLPGVYATLSRILFAVGEFSLVQEYASQGIAVYDARQHSPHVSHVAHDPGVNCLSSQA